MPPWKPHPGAGVFLDAPRLSVVEKETLRLWAQTGCPRGDPADLPAPPVFRDRWQLGEPDLVLSVAEPFDVPAGGPDLYASFPLRAARPRFDDRRTRVPPGKPAHRAPLPDPPRCGTRYPRLEEQTRFQEIESTHSRDRARSSALSGARSLDTRHDARLAPEGDRPVDSRGADVVLQVHSPTAGPNAISRASACSWRRSP